MRDRLSERGARVWLIASMVLVAFALRLALIFVWHTYRSAGPAYRPDWFGAETGSIARSIAEGHGFSSPFGGDTGPTAWIAPIYPYLCAAVFKIFGIFGETSAQVIFALNSLFSALTCVPIYLIGVRVFSRRAALLAAWTWALAPFFMRWPTTWVWDISLSALLAAFLVLAAIRASEDHSTRDWVVLGLLIGLSALVNPALLTIGVVGLAWAALRSRRPDTSIIRKLAIALIIAATLVSPWLVRNRVVFGQFVFLRSNFGFELHLGNYHLSNGMGWSGRHPLINPNEYRRYQQLGELGYVRSHTRDAVEFIRNYPGEFARLTAHRFLWFWDGTYILYTSGETWKTWMYWPLSLITAAGALLAFRKRIRGAGLVAATILLYPLPYYLTYPQHRYRHAVEPLMLLSSAFAVVTVIDAIRERMGRNTEPVTAPTNKVEQRTERDVVHSASLEIGR